jgi:glycosyltransferase involved in cell wall biosynthesis
MHLVVFSHKPCWASPESSTGYATDGGFPLQMEALSELFDQTTLVVPVGDSSSRSGEIELRGHNLQIVPVTMPTGRGGWRKAIFPWWLLRNAIPLLEQGLKADAIHAPIPGDIGTIGILLAKLLDKPLFVRHCGNWAVQRTLAEKFWRWLMERLAGGKNVMMATGGDLDHPSSSNPNVQWIFSTTMTTEELTSCALIRTVPAPENHVKLIIVCRQEWGKGTDTVIRALPTLLEHFPLLLLDVVGDGSARQSFEELARACQVEQHVTFHGRVNHALVLELLQDADLFCYPTSSEGFPKVVLEALACGLPVVTTRVSVLPYLVGPDCGVLIDEPTPSTVALAVQALLSAPEQYSQMSRQALETARGYSLEEWQNLIRSRLTASWGALRS